MSDDTTPLPWRVEDNLPGSEGHVWIYAPNAADVWHRTIASVGDMEEIDGEDLANAAFIVRAVNSHDDLVAACQATISRMTTLLEHPEPEVILESFLTEAREWLQDALAKATGDTDGR